MTKKQGDDYFNICRLIYEHNIKYNTTLSLIELSKKEYDAR